MSDDLYNDDVVIDTTDILDNSSSVSDISDNSSSITPPSVTPPTVDPIPVSDDISRVIDGWIKDTSDTGGESGEVYEDIPPVEKDPPSPPVYKTVIRTIQEIITNYDQEYLRSLASTGGKFYVYYKDGTRDEVDYTEILDPYTAQYGSINFEVDEITKANNQHFWYDDNGAHVTDETRESWEENVAYNFSDLSDNNNHNNLLMNSYGLVIRRALKNLAAFSRSAVTFYDGDGNETSNILAMFGKNGVQLGSLEQSRIVLNSNGFSYFSEDDVNLFNLSINTASDETIYVDTRDIISHTANSTTNLDLSHLPFAIKHPVYRAMRLWPPYKDTRIIITILPEPGVDAVSEDMSFMYGEKTDGWVNWTHGRYRYDGENIVEIYSTIGMYIDISLSKPISISRYNFGDCLSEGDYSFAEGHLTRSMGFASHAEGEDTIASGISSHAEGYNTSSGGNYSHAEGCDSSARESYSHAEGRLTHAEGSASHAEGYSTYSIGEYSHAEGTGTHAEGLVSHAEGYSTYSIGEYSHAEGSGTYAEGSISHAEGYNTSSSGDHSHAEGHNTSSSGNYSHAEGSDSSAYGSYSHAEGYSTKTTENGYCSHVQNLGTISDGNYQTIIGKYNKIDGTLPFIIGNGLSNDERANCFEIDWNGTIDFGPQAISRNTNATLVMQNRSSQIDYGGFYICNKNIDVSNYVVRQHVRENANNGVRWYRTEISRTVNNSRAYNAISIGLDNTNKAVYGVTNPSAFRSAINAVDANRLEIIEYADPRFIIYGTSGTAIEFLYNSTSKNLAVRGYNGTSWTSYKPIINLA